MRALGNDLPIMRIEAKAGRKGRLKGGIERYLGTLNRTLLQEQRGTTFSNIIDRKDYDPKKNAVITYEELLEKVHAFLIDVYMRRKHNGIKDTPINLWNKKIVEHTPFQIENADSVLALFGRIEHRILRRDGIRWKHLFFTSPELLALLSKNEFRKASTNHKGDVVVRFRFDPSNIDHIHVYLPHARGAETMHLYVRVEKRAQKYARGLSVWAHDAIVKMVRETIDAEVDLASLDRAKVSLVELMDLELPGSAKVRGTLRIARIRQLGGVAPFGDSVLTTPVGSFEDRRQEAAVAAMTTPVDRSKPIPAQAPSDSSLPDLRDMDTVEDDEVPEDGAGAQMPGRQVTKPENTRRSDPATVAAKRGRPAGKGRKATPMVAVTANKDEIDFYSKGIRA